MERSLVFSIWDALRPAENQVTKTYKGMSINSWIRSLDRSISRIAEKYFGWLISGDGGSRTVRHPSYKHYWHISRTVTYKIQQQLSWSAQDSREIIYIHYHDGTLNIRAEQKIQNNSNWICSLTIHHPTAHIIRPIRFQQRLERWQRYNVHQLQTRNLSKWVELKLIIIAKVWQAANGFWSRINHSQDSAGLRLGDELTRMGWNGERWITMDKIRVFQIKRLISEPLALFIIGSSF